MSLDLGINLLLYLIVLSYSMLKFLLLFVIFQSNYLINLFSVFLVLNLDLNRKLHSYLVNYTARAKCFTTLFIVVMMMSSGAIYATTLSSIYDTLKQAEMQEYPMSLAPWSYTELSLMIGFALSVWFLPAIALIGKQEHAIVISKIQHSRFYHKSRRL